MLTILLTLTFILHHRLSGFLILLSSFLFHFKWNQQSSWDCFLMLVMMFFQHLPSFIVLHVDLRPMESSLKRGSLRLSAYWYFNASFRSLDWSRRGRKVYIFTSFKIFSCILTYLRFCETIEQIAIDPISTNIIEVKCEASITFVRVSVSATLLVTLGGLRKVGQLMRKWSRDASGTLGTREMAFLLGLFANNPQRRKPNIYI